MKSEGLYEPKWKHNEWQFITLSYEEDFVHQIAVQLFGNKRVYTNGELVCFLNYLTTLW
jgi:hypothetical protein